MSRHGSPRIITAFLVAGLLCLVTVSAALADYEPDSTAPRSEVPKGYQWNSTDIFPDNETF